MSDSEYTAPQLPNAMQLQFDVSLSRREWRFGSSWRDEAYHLIVSALFGRILFASGLTNLLRDWRMEGVVESVFEVVPLPFFDCHLLLV